MSDTPPLPDAGLEEKAKPRFFILISTRIIGALLAMLGILVFADRINFIPQDGRMMLGLIFFFAGLIAALWIPQSLAHKWRSPDQ